MAKGVLTTPVVNLTINQGADYTFQITIKDDSGKPVDITGNEYVCKVRETAESDEVIIEADTEIFDASSGLVTIHFKDEDTALIDTEGETYADMSEYTYDILQREPNGNVTRILNGSLFVSPGVSFH